MSLYPVSREEVTELYVATFNRAPDTGGLIYWSDHAGMTLEQIAASFFVQPETQALYPEALSNEVFVNTIYNNVFNRDAEPGGLAYWVDALESGSVSRANMILAIVNGAQNTPIGQDQRVLDNKTEVGLYFAQNGRGLTIEQAYEVMADVTSEGSTIIAALTQIDTWSDAVPNPPIPPAPVMELTVEIDTIEGSDIDSVINGLVFTDTPEKNTLNSADTIDGGGGNDILKITIAGQIGTSTPIANLSNVETIFLSNTSGGDQLIDMTGTTGLENIVITGSGNTIVTGTTVTLIDAKTSTGELTVDGSMVGTSGAVITGGSANDTIDLATANAASSNEITGGEGADTLTASAGEDLFLYARSGDTGITVADADTIKSFSTGSDKINFDSLAAGTGAFDTAAADSFADAQIAADAAFAGGKGAIIYSYQVVGSTGYLFVDSDADNVADEVIEFTGIGAGGVAAGDILA